MMMTGTACVVIIAMKHPGRIGFDVVGMAIVCISYVGFFIYFTKLPRQSAICKLC